MYRKLKEMIGFGIVAVFFLLSTQMITAENIHFADVPEDHWANKAIHDLRSLKITDGIGGNNYGMGLEITRSEFVAFLVKLMKWDLIKPETGNFIDNEDPTKWYFSYIETALAKGVISEKDNAFRPAEPITREEMAIMLVKTLGYDSLASQLDKYASDFEDVSSNTGYITIAKDFGIINGVGNNQFKPADKAKREEAAAMMMRMYDKLNKSISDLHAFYAIESSPQMDKLSDLDSVSFGWSRLEYDPVTRQVVLNTTRNNDNAFYIPPGFTTPVSLAQEHNLSTQLMVFADNDKWINPGDDNNITLVEYIVTKPEVRRQVISSIVQQANHTTSNGQTISFNGVVIDFESLSGEMLKQYFVLFLKELKQDLEQSAKKLYVTVQPDLYYDGYDYKAIGSIADKVIFMAHNYSDNELTEYEMNIGFTITPLTPIEEVYSSLKAITDKENGIIDSNKIWLQISFDSIQWKLRDGKVIKPKADQPKYDKIQQRLIQNNVKMSYSDFYRNPSAIFTDDDDGTDNVLWYEDSNSVLDKIKLARMFGINGISLWRLGLIPDYEEADTKQLNLDVWQKILNETRK